MELEKEINQKKFNSEYHKAAINLIYSYNWLLSFVRKELDPYNITTQQFNILRILRGNQPEPASIGLLKQRMLDKMCDASRIVDRLLEKGLVNRSINKEDRRSSNIYITDAGLALLDQITLHDRMDELLKNISLEEATILNKLLDKLRG